MRYKTLPLKRLGRESEEQNHYIYMRASGSGISDIRQADVKSLKPYKIVALDDFIFIIMLFQVDIPSIFSYNYIQLIRILNNHY